MADAGQDRPGPIQFKSWHYILFLAGLFTVKDLVLNQMSSSSSQPAQSSQPSEKYRNSELDEGTGYPPSQYDKLPSVGSKLSAGKMGGPAIKFLFCSS